MWHAAVRIEAMHRMFSTRDALEEGEVKAPLRLRMRDTWSAKGCRYYSLVITVGAHSRVDRQYRRLDAVIDWHYWQHRFGTTVACSECRHDGFRGSSGGTG